MITELKATRRSEPETAITLYHARARIGGKLHDLGIFQTEAAAQAAVDDFHAMYSPLPDGGAVIFPHTWLLKHFHIYS